MLDKFENLRWPCRKRIAHGRHLIYEPDDPLEQGFSYTQGELRDTFWCPGVSAHPGVMIGRGELPVKKEHE